MGDIHMKLYPEECPRTVENFTTHCRNGYYDNLIFHRVIKGFMIQTGDPLGDGTGGQSIWGREFEDEFHKRSSPISRFPILACIVEELFSFCFTFFSYVNLQLILYLVWVKVETQIDGIYLSLFLVQFTT